jgi:hypothetical protein
MIHMPVIPREQSNLIGLKNYFVEKHLKGILLQL